MYVNLGDGSMPQNFSLPMVPVFQITGPTKQPYPGTICLPQVPLPANYSAVLGGNATIQVVETAVHGAALYNVSFVLCLWMLGSGEGAKEMEELEGGEERWLLQGFIGWNTS